MIMNNTGYFSRKNSDRAKFAPQRDNYSKPDTRVEYQIFSSDYFSNADVKIFFGDIWIDDATSIAFQLQEDIMPIYGYNSFTYDAMARGKRIVQGSFGINFTTVGYLHQVIANANAIFYALEKGEEKGLIQTDYYQTKKLSEILTSLGKHSFEQIADEYEKAIWGESDDDDTLLNYANQPFFRQDDLGFDIRIQYGAVTEMTGYVQDDFYKKEKKTKPNVTVDVLNGVQIGGMSKEISTASQGAPIQEMYSFMARDLNGVSFAHLQRGLEGGTTAKSKGKTTQYDTTYRKMQYGPIR